MPPKKKNKLKIPQSAVKILIVAVLSLVMGLAVCKGVWYALLNSNYFKVKYIVMEPALQFINKRDIQRVKGKSIFAVNLSEIQEKLGYRYPQVSQLRVIRRFPNTIYIAAKQRKPIAQTKVNNQILTLDEKGVILSTTSKQDGKVPFIKGVNLKKKRVSLGQPFRGREIWVALKLIKTFKENRVLEPYQIIDLDIQNLSKIELQLSNKLKVFMDKDDIERKIKLLGFVLSKGQLEVDEVRYLDLRFKEPIKGIK